jgi:hypothetical protein
VAVTLLQVGFSKGGNQQKSRKGEPMRLLAKQKTN